MAAKGAGGNAAWTPWSSTRTTMNAKKAAGMRGDAPKKKTVSISGVKHTVKKVGKKVVVDHAGAKGKKWDKINLTKKAGAKTVRQGVAASRKYHASKPHGGRRG